MEFDLIVSSQPEDQWSTKVRVGTSATSLSAGTTFVVQPGHNEILLNLLEYGIAPFDTDVVLTVETTTTLNTAAESATGCTTTELTTVAIPLPVVFVHGYIAPEGAMQNHLAAGIAFEFHQPSSGATVVRFPRRFKQCADLDK